MSLLLALQSASGAINYTDSLSVGSYTASGIALTDVKTTASIAYADNLSVGYYAVSGKSITDLFSHNDTLSSGIYVISGKSITDNVVISDILTTGNYVVSGKIILDSVGKIDNLIHGNYVALGNNLTDVITSAGGTNYTDLLSLGNYLITGYSLIDELITVNVKDGGDDVPRKIKTEKYKPRLKKDDFGNEIQPEIKTVIVKKVSNYTLQDTKLLLNRLELQAEQDDEEAIFMLL